MVIGERLHLGILNFILHVPTVTGKHHKMSPNKEVPAQIRYNKSVQIITIK